MSSQRPSYLRSYAFAVGVAFAAAGGAALLGYWPTAQLYGERGVQAMLVGCGVSWLASCVGAITVASACSGGSRDASLALLAATALRMFAALGFTAPLVLSGWFDNRVLIVWISVSYLVTLAVDTLVAVRMTKRVYEND